MWAWNPGVASVALMRSSRFGYFSSEESKHKVINTLFYLLFKIYLRFFIWSHLKITCIHFNGNN